MDLESKTSPLLVDTQGWNDYWNQKNLGGVLYALVAAFYRKFIIRPHLNRFIYKYFKKGSVLLHAGCGSGQVDADISKYAAITALDISKDALRLYQSFNGESSETVHGSILDIQLRENSFDGIYNLGVLEHFTLEEIQKILAQFRRVLKDSGRLVIFWPPEFGLSVLFFKALRKLVKFFSGKKVKFHPDEISRVQSRESVIAIFHRAGFEVIEYSFGVRDLWTYSIIVSAPKKT